MAFEIVTSRTQIRNLFEVWRDALLGGATRGERLWFLPDEKIVFRNQDNPASRTLGPRVALGTDPTGHNWAVQINEPGRKTETQSAIARDSNGAPVLIRKGRLNNNKFSGAPVTYATFNERAYIKPIDLLPSSKAPWYLVAQLDKPQHEIRRETAAFVDLCSVVRGADIAVSTNADIAVLKRLQTNDEHGGSYIIGPQDAAPEKVVDKKQGDVWAIMADMLRTAGYKVGKEPTINGYQVDATVSGGPMSVSFLIEIKSGSSASDIHMGVGQLALYRRLFPGLKSFIPMLLLPKKPIAEISDAIRACGIEVHIYEYEKHVSGPQVEFSKEFRSVFGL